MARSPRRPLFPDAEVDSIRIPKTGRAGLWFIVLLLIGGGAAGARWANGLRTSRPEVVPRPVAQVPSAPGASAATASMPPAAVSVGSIEIEVPAGPGRVREHGFMEVQPGPAASAALADAAAAGGMADAHPATEASVPPPVAPVVAPAGDEDPNNPYN